VKEIRGIKVRGEISPAIIASQYNKPIVEKLVQGAVRCFLDQGVKEEKISVYWVPGAFEIPLLAKQLCQLRKYDCLVCVGCVLKGETYHFDQVALQASSGIAKVSLDTGIPISFSVLLSDNPQTAWERAGENEKNRGHEGALAALEMVNLLRSLRKKSDSNRKTRKTAK
jgi:6,7-dimethyl-8-ribityllumazine synthase